MVARALVALALLCSVAYADDAKPWVNVGEAEQKQAFDLYAEGNALFEHDRYKEALEKYDLALKIWDHPAIRYNAAVCLINLDRWLDAYDYLTAAMRFGEEPLGHDLWRQAQMNMKAVEGKVAELDVKCDEPGATVSLDGEVLFTAPSSAHRRVLTDKTHQIIAQKKDYQTETRAIRLEPGKPTTLVLELHPLPQHRALVRRWSKWKPWAVTGAGAAVALVGGGFALAARGHYSDYDKQVDANFSGHTDPNTPPPLPDQNLLHAGDRDANIAYSALAVGGAIAVTGFVMVLLNQPHLAPMVTPVIGKESAGAVISLSW
jgi:tetratricopeptide (TPR) repeat protein